MLCITWGNTVEQVRRADSWYTTFKDDSTPLKEILNSPHLGEGFSVWKIGEEYIKGRDFWEYKNPILLHDGGAYTEAAQAEREREEREWREEIAREEGMLNGIESYNDYMGY